MNGLHDRLLRIYRAGHRGEVSGLLDDALYAPKRVRAAAVLVAVTARPRPGILLTQRPRSMRDHAGQIAFPGGKLETGENAVEAALREAQEELSMNPAAVRVIGTSDRFISATGFAITPVLGVVPPDISIVPHPEEVDGWFEAPLDHLLDANRFRRGEMLVRGEKRSYLETTWEGHRIWGVTAAILHNLSRRLAWRELDVS